MGILCACECKLFFFVEFKIVFSEMKSCHKTLILSSSIFALFQDFYHGRILMQCFSLNMLSPKINISQKKMNLLQRILLFDSDMFHRDTNLLILNRSNQYYIQTWLFS